MTFFADFFTAMMMALLLENTLFARALGTSRFIRLLNSPSEFLPFSIILTTVLTVASAVSYLVVILLLPFGNILTLELSSLQPFIYLSIIALVALGLGALAKYKMKTLYSKYSDLLLPATINCAVLGTILLGVRDYSNSFASFLGLGMGSGIGFSLAVLIVFMGKKRLDKMNIPQPFKGLPIQLIYIGIISLAIYGFIGGSILL